MFNINPGIIDENEIKQILKIFKFKNEYLNIFSYQLLANLLSEFVAQFPISVCPFSLGCPSKL